ncbi:hypothetical protein ABZP36_010319 [Zizania latifolia]
MVSKQGSPSDAAGSNHAPASPPFATAFLLPAVASPSAGLPPRPAPAPRASAGLAPPCRPTKLSSAPALIAGPNTLPGPAPTTDMTMILSIPPRRRRAPVTKLARAGNRRRSSGCGDLSRRRTWWG